MTAGEVVSEGSVLVTLGTTTTWVRPLQVDSAASYPTQLLNQLKARYTGQAGAFVVANAGKPAEMAVDGVNRLPTVIDGGAYKVLLLMEGANDLPDYQAALGAMRQMVQYGKRRGMLVYLANLPPQNPFPSCTPNRGGNWAFVSPYNDGLRDIANSEGVPLVDVHTAFHGDNTTLVDCDGLHPTPAGYKVIADTFFQSIQATLEVPATATPTVAAARSFISKK
jgi:lysophospholipase L1-like esterase